jgi:hypothetical protein
MPAPVQAGKPLRTGLLLALPVALLLLLVVWSLAPSLSLLLLLLTGSTRNRSPPSGSMASHSL